MNIGALSSVSSLLLNSLAKTRGDAPADMSIALPRPANPAGALSILPINSARQLSFESILQLQSLDEPEPQTIEPPSATEIFLEEARKTPMERLREQILAELGMTEESLAQLPADERRVAEDKIRAMIEEKLRQGFGVDGEPGESNAAMLQTLA